LLLTELCHDSQKCKLLNTGNNGKGIGNLGLKQH
jgi:hypothetical protein